VYKALKQLKDLQKDASRDLAREETAEHAQAGKEPSSGFVPASGFADAAATASGARLYPSIPNITTETTPAAAPPEQKAAA
jgi:hypothetical protein